MGNINIVTHDIITRFIQHIAHPDQVQQVKNTLSSPLHSIPFESKMYNRFRHFSSTLHQLFPPIPIVDLASI